MSAHAIERMLRTIVDLLVQRDYAALERLSHGARLQAHEMEEGVREYGRTLIMPPGDAFARADVIPISGAAPPAYSVRFRLYTQEEGLSDLELQATLTGDADAEMMNVEIDNILVA
jgi:hypothetical protein